jgi:hypothetical protein
MEIGSRLRRLELRLAFILTELVPIFALTSFVIGKSLGQVVAHRTACSLDTLMMIWDVFSGWKKNDTDELKESLTQVVICTRVE